MGGTSSKGGAPRHFITATTVSGKEFTINYNHKLDNKSRNEFGRFVGYLQEKDSEIATIHFAVEENEPFYVNEGALKEFDGDIRDAEFVPEKIVHVKELVLMYNLPWLPTDNEMNSYLQTTASGIAKFLKMLGLKADVIRFEENLLGSVKGDEPNKKKLIKMIHELNYPHIKK